jgi:hypothetical protein
MRFQRLPVLIAGLVALAPAWATPAEKAPPKAAAESAKNPFVRLVRDDKQRPLGLETAIVRHTPKDHRPAGLTVDLVAAVHVAEKGYYQQINREFADYDVVLYELVAPEGAKVPKGGEGPRSKHPVSMLQTGLKSLLELSFQLDEVDYTAKNLVHADMSPEQFSKSMADRGESYLDIFTRMMGYAMAQQGRKGEGATSDVELLAALLDKNRAMVLKRLMAEQFEDLEGPMAAIEGPNGSTLVSQRNKVALDVLRQQIKAGKRKIAIFYGAAHMPDMQKRLQDDFRLEPVSTRWLPAWDLKDKKAEEKKTGEKKIEAAKPKS